mgnify:CR=1 FL=1
MARRGPQDRASLAAAAGTEDPAPAGGAGGGGADRGRLRPDHARRRDRPRRGAAGSRAAPGGLGDRPGHSRGAAAPGRRLVGGRDSPRRHDHGVGGRHAFGAEVLPGPGPSAHAASAVRRLPAVRPAGTAADRLAQPTRGGRRGPCGGNARVRVPGHCRGHRRRSQPGRAAVRPRGAAVRPRRGRGRPPARRPIRLGPAGWRHRRGAAGDPGRRRRSGRPSRRRARVLSRARLGPHPGDRCGGWAGGRPPRGDLARRWRGG